MEEIIKQIIKTCALRYSKGFPRWIHQWDERLSMDQKAKEIAEEMERQGYIIIKDSTYPLRESEDIRLLVDDNGE